MQLFKLHRLVLLAFLALFLYEASAWTHGSPGNDTGATDPKSIKLQPHSRDKALECRLNWQTKDFSPQRIHSETTDFFQRHFNFHWFLRKHSTNDPPALRLKVQNYCYPTHKVCHWLADELPKFVTQAIVDINYWLYTSPYNESSFSFCPKYPPVNGIRILLGVGEFEPYEAAFVPRELYEDNTMNVYFNTRSFGRLLKEHPKWKVLKIAQYVLTHELVHTLQQGSILPEDDSLIGGICDGLAPHGLLEGIADFVALKAGTSHPLWPARPRRSDQLLKRWDTGYIPTAYFLEWLEDVRIGPGAIGRLNDRIGKVGYFAKDSRLNPCFRQPDTWKTLFGSSVTELWDEYGQYIDTHKPYIEYVVEFVAHPITLAVFGALVFGIIFFPLVWDFVKDLHPVNDVLLLAPLYIRTTLLWLREFSFSKFWTFLKQFSLNGFLAAGATSCFIWLNILLLRDTNMAILDVGLTGCLYSLLMRWMHELADADMHIRRDRSLGRLRGYDLTWELYGRILLIANGMFLAICLWTLRDRGVPLIITVSFGLLCFIPHFYMDPIVHVLKQCINFMLMLTSGASLPDERLGGRSQTRPRTRTRTGSYHRRRPPRNQNA